MKLSELLKTTRQHFWSQDFSEVEVPYLNSSLPLEPNIYSFKTIWSHASTEYYLPTSPEFALKQHLSQNKTNCFAISHCFRDLENSGPHHTPEFLMLEWYLINKNLDDLKLSLENYLRQFLPDLVFSEFKLANNKFDNEPDFNQLFLNEIEPTLPRHGGVFISGYPNFLSPLSEPNQRFELYINGIEVANGCTENRDPESIKSAFLAEQEFRQKNHLPSHPISTDFIKTCASLPPCSGLGLGIDRLLMIINHQQAL